MIQRLHTPISLAKAGAQIHPALSGVTRASAASAPVALVGSIWLPAFAGTLGSGE